LLRLWASSAGQVGEDAGSEADVFDPAQRQRVGRHFHRAGTAAIDHHLAQQPLYFVGFRRRPRGIFFLAAVVVGHRADAAAANARFIEDGGGDVRSRRLAVGPGDADHQEIVGGMREEDGGERRQRLAGVGGLQPGRGPAGGRIAFRDDRDGALDDRLLGEARTIGVFAFQGDEHRTGGDVA
jgi:hypothetical protein